MEGQIASGTKLKYKIYGLWVLESKLQVDHKGVLDRFQELPFCLHMLDLVLQLESLLLEHFNLKYLVGLLMSG
jgi:hypothetical protein